MFFRYEWQKSRVSRETVKFPYRLKNTFTREEKKPRIIPKRNSFHQMLQTLAVIILGQ